MNKIKKKVRNKDMRCSDCPHYRSGYMYNSCAVTQAEYFMELINCNLVHKDGSLNYDDEFIKIEYGNGEERQ